MKRFLKGLTLLVVGLSLVWATPAKAQIRGAPLATPDTLAANDDGSSGAVSIGFTINFFGINYTTLYVNNNGNVTFGSANPTYNPSEISLATTPMLAPFLADVDTRGAGSSLVNWGYRSFPWGIPSGQAGASNPRDVFVVNWLDVGYYNSHASPLNRFQLVIIDRGDVAAGDFDFEFNYGPMLWEAGDASNGINGLCPEIKDNENPCDPARAGWSNGTGSSFEFASSGTDGGLIDGGTTPLTSYATLPPASTLADSLGNTGGWSPQPNGRHTFAVRSGKVTGVVPEPMTFVLMGTGLIGIGLVQIRRRRNSDEV
jgi:hypothetical protein